MKKSAFASLLSIFFASAAVPAVAQSELVVGYPSTIPNPAQLNFFQEQFSNSGINVTWVEVENAEALNAALASGDINVSYAHQLDSLLAAQAAGLNYQIVGVAEARPNPTDCFLGGVSPTSPIDPTELTGRTVGLPIGTLTHWAMTQQLQNLGIDVQQLEVVDLPQAAAISALEKGSVDIACGPSSVMRPLSQSSRRLTQIDWLSSPSSYEASMVAVPQVTIENREEDVQVFLSQLNAIYGDPNIVAEIDAQYRAQFGNSLSEPSQPGSLAYLPTANTLWTPEWFGGGLQQEIDAYSEIIEAAGVPNSVVSTGNSIIDPSFIERNGKLRTVELFYGTNREAVQDAPRARYSWQRDDELKRGTVTVSIPEDHVRDKGELNRPFELRLLRGLIDLSGAEDPLEHFVVVGHQTMGLDSFTNKIEDRKAISQSFKNHVLFFIHGYNTSFDEASYQTAQLVYDLGFDGVPVFFSWPSVGETEDYVTDLDSSELAAPHLAELIVNVLDGIEFDEVHFVAHSMGARALLRSLKLIEQEQLGRQFPLGEVVVAAPDVDREIFESLLSEAQDRISGITLYASQNDKAMIASRTIRSNYYRAGDVSPTEGPLVLSNMFTIDISDLGKSLFSIEHRDFASEPVVLKDIGLILSDPQRMRYPRVRDPSFQVVPVSETKSFFRF